MYFLPKKFDNYFLLFIAISVQLFVFIQLENKEIFIFLQNEHDQYTLIPNVKLWRTPGHTSHDISVIIEAPTSTMVIAGKY